MGVDRAKDLRIDPSHVFAGQGSRDGISAAEGYGWYGPAPIDPEFGGRTFNAGDSDHGGYWTDPNSLPELGKIITGQCP